MSGWVHDREYRTADQVLRCHVIDITNRACGCTNPTPDPASPCGYEWCQHRGAYWWHTALRVGGDHDQWDRLHPHQPTTCLHCHHGIRRAEGGA